MVLPPHFIHQRLELINVFKTAVDAGKAHIGHFVELLELAHDEFTDAGGGQFTNPQGQKLFFNTLNSAIYLLGADGRLRSASFMEASSLARSYSMRRPSFLTIAGKLTSGRS